MSLMNLNWGILPQIGDCLFIRSIDSIVRGVPGVLCLVPGQYSASPHSALTQCSGKTKVFKVLTVYRGQFFNLGVSNASLVYRFLYTSYPISNLSVSDGFFSNFTWVFVSETFGLGLQMS